jgi:hypothetical protein
MHRRLIIALTSLVVTAVFVAATCGQTLELGKLDSVQPKLKLKPNDVGLSVLKLTTGKAVPKLIRLRSTEDNAPAIRSGDRPRNLDVWYVFAGAVEIEIRFLSFGSDLSLEIADAPPRSKPLVFDELRGPIDVEPNAIVPVSLLFPKVGRASTETHVQVREPTDRLSLLIAVVAALLVLLGLAFGWMWFKRRREVAAEQREAQRSRVDNEVGDYGPQGRPETQAHPSTVRAVNNDPYSSPGRRRPGAETVLRPSPVDPLNVGAPRPEQVARPDLSLESLKERVDEMSKKISTMADLQGRDGFRRRLEDAGYFDGQQQAAQIAAETRAFCEQFNKAVIQNSSELAVVRQQVEAFNRSFAGLRAEATKRLDAALAVLGNVYAGQLPSSRDEQALIAQKLDEELTRFFRQAVPPRDGLITRRDRSRRLQHLANQLVEKFGSSGLEEGDQRLAPGIRETSSIDREISGLVGDSQSQRLTLDFQVDMSSSTASRELLGDALATGLRRQIQKLSDPLDHFDRRIEAVSLSLAQSAADLIDIKADMIRRDSTLQTCFEALVKEAGLEVLDPEPGTDYLPAEHNIVQMIPRTLDARSRQVARTATRGFRRAGSVVRKASVILYE